MTVTESITTDAKPIPRWKVGLWAWREEGEWRLRLYRPWSTHRILEVRTERFLFALYMMGIAAKWWDPIKES